MDDTATRLLRTAESLLGWQTPLLILVGSIAAAVALFLVLGAAVTLRQNRASPSPGSRAVGFLFGVLHAGLGGASLLGTLSLPSQVRADSVLGHPAILLGWLALSGGAFLLGAASLVAALRRA